MHGHGRCRARRGAISPFILGVSGDLVRPRCATPASVNSWGGNPSTRYNYEIGNVWNAADDWEYRNTNYGEPGLDPFDCVPDQRRGRRRRRRLAVPTLGWVAKTTTTSCSFPDGAGGCRTVDAATARTRGPIADPSRTSVESTPEMVADWVAACSPRRRRLQFIAMDNEPDLWGYTHYDVHPTCPTYEEMLDKYLQYADASGRGARRAAARAGDVLLVRLLGHRTRAGRRIGRGLLSWFLAASAPHDEAAGRRTLDVLDVHFYPQSDVYNDDVDAETNARGSAARARCGIPSYTRRVVDRRTDRVHPADAARRSTSTTRARGWSSRSGTSAPTATMNGALAIADVLGVYGREGVYAAAYWRSPPAGSPGFLAFKMHGNYDGEGGRFAGDVVEATSEDAVQSAHTPPLDEADGVLRVMLVNRDPDTATTSASTWSGAPTVTPRQDMDRRATSRHRRRRRRPRRR